jgi:hypothetical protein
LSEHSKLDPGNAPLLVRRSGPRRAFAAEIRPRSTPLVSDAGERATKQPLGSENAEAGVSKCSGNQLKNELESTVWGRRGNGETKRGLFSWRSSGASKR